ncbi:hypothetical protein J2T61_000457 [Methanocalculus sp. AMF5]|nr:hypothetical protein [Methanocalculus sp. AMF5]
MPPFQGYEPFKPATTLILMKSCITLYERAVLIPFGMVHRY